MAARARRGGGGSLALRLPSPRSYINILIIAWDTAGHTLTHPNCLRRPTGLHISCTSCRVLSAALRFQRYRDALAAARGPWRGRDRCPQEGTGPSPARGLSPSIFLEGDSATNQPHSHSGAEARRGPPRHPQRPQRAAPGLSTSLQPGEIAVTPTAAFNQLLQLVNFTQRPKEQITARQECRASFFGCSEEPAAAEPAGPGSRAQPGDPPPPGGPDSGHGGLPPSRML